MRLPAAVGMLFVSALEQRPAGAERGPRSASPRVVVSLLSDGRPGASAAQSIRGGGQGSPGRGALLLADRVGEAHRVRGSPQ